MEKLIPVAIACFLTYNASIFIWILCDMFIESVISRSKISVILQLIFGVLSIIAFFTATLRLSEKIIFNSTDRR